jgi:hypothetical protein
VLARGANLVIGVWRGPGAEGWMGVGARERPRRGYMLGGRGGQVGEEHVHRIRGSLVLGVTWIGVVQCGWWICGGEVGWLRPRYSAVLGAPANFAVD